MDPDKGPFRLEDGDPQTYYYVKNPFQKDRVIEIEYPEDQPYIIRNPLAYVGVGGMYDPDVCIYPELEPNSSMPFPLKFLDNYPECSISSEFRTYFIKGREL